MLHVRQRIARRIHAAIDQRWPSAIARPIHRLLRHPPHRDYILAIHDHARKSAGARQQAHRLQQRSISRVVAAVLSVEVFFVDCLTEELLPMPPSLEKSQLYRSE